MTLRHFFVLLGILAIAPAAAVGCTSSTEEEEDDDGMMSQDAISATAQKLVGAWQDQGQAVTPPTVKGLILNPDNSFWADFDSGIRPACLPGGPCPDGRTRIEGTFSAGTKYLTLSPKAGAARTDYHGRYKYMLQGEKLTLTRTAQGQSWFDSLSREPSYCKAVADCGTQFLAQPRCIGAWSCASNACRYNCFQPPPPTGGCNRHTSISECNGDAACRAVVGPSWCSPDGRICSRDFALKSCDPR